MKALFSGTVFFLCLFSCYHMISQNKGSDLEKYGKVYSFDSRSNIMEIKVNRGEKFSIELKGNPSTGFSWYLKNRETIDKTKLAPLNLNVQGSSKNYLQGSKRIDATVSEKEGVYYFIFQALVSGTKLDLVFERRRPNNLNLNPQETLVAKIQVL